MIPTNALGIESHTAATQQSPVRLYPGPGQYGYISGTGAKRDQSSSRHWFTCFTVWVRGCRSQGGGFPCPFLTSSPPPFFAEQYPGVLKPLRAAVPRSDAPCYIRWLVANWQQLDKDKESWERSAGTH
jgi:hypothetical protein